MGQDDVLEILKTTRHGQGLTSKEVHKRLEASGKTLTLGSVTCNLKKLIRGRLVLRYYVDKNYHLPKYILAEKATLKIKKSITQIPYWMNVNPGVTKCQCKKTVA